MRVASDSLRSLRGTHGAGRVARGPSRPPGIPSSTARRIVAPIRALSRAADEVAHGHFDQSVDPATLPR